MSGRTRGNSNWAQAVDLVELPPNRTMICGLNIHFDLYRPGRCHAAFVASRGKDCSSWWFNVGLHKSLDQVPQQMSANIVEASKVFKSLNDDQLPERVITYVDGVAVSKLELVLRNQLESIRETINGVGRIKLTLIFINRTVGSNSNLRLGRNRFETFCLVDDRTLRSYDTSAEYKIVHDESGFNIELQEVLAQQLCAMRVDRMGRTAVPVPCQMAQELVELCHKLHNRPKA